MAPAVIRFALCYNTTPQSSKDFTNSTGLLISISRASFDIQPGASVTFLLASGESSVKLCNVSQTNDVAYQPVLASWKTCAHHSL